MNTESPPHVLTCAYNNRRRNRFHPLTHPNIIINNDAKMNIQVFKPNKPIIYSKIRKNSICKLSENAGAEKNIGDWSTLLSKGGTHEKAPKILTSQESSSSLRGELLCEMRPSMFRQTADYDDREETMVLKRANPVYDSDDEDYVDSMPFKRQRTLGGTTTLQLGERLQETSDALSSMFLLQE